MERLEVRVGCITANGASPSTRFAINIDMGNGLTQRERAILFNSARNCEVGKILTGPVDIEYGYDGGLTNGKDHPAKRFERHHANLEAVGYPPHDGSGEHGP